MSFEYQLRLPIDLPHDPLEDQYVSQCASCNKMLRICEVQVMEDGEHCCHDGQCIDAYMLSLVHRRKP